MIKIDSFDFRDSHWSEIASTLIGFRDEAHLQSVYAYVRAAPGLQMHMVCKLIRELDLLDNICTDIDACAEMIATRH